MLLAESLERAHTHYIFKKDKNGDRKDSNKSL